MQPPQTERSARATTHVLNEDRVSERTLRLLVVTEEELSTHLLPGSGNVVIGRGAGCDVLIEDPSISRQHARLHIGTPLRLEDLASVNGTCVKEQRIQAHEPVVVAEGEAFTLGAVTLVVQRRLASARPRRLWSHGYFEGRLDEECLRAEAAGARFAVLRAQDERSGPRGALLESLVEVARPVDVVGSYGPGEYEALIVDVTPTEAAQIVERLSADLEKRGVRAKLGIACYPSDGRSTDALLCRARDVMLGQPAAPAAQPSIVVCDPGMQRVRALAERVAAGTLSVLLLGETGTGKEVLAELIHALSPRAAKPLLRLNCAALSETLLESELFGHERGAFTGALKAKPGLLETAHEGTVLLDEIGELPMSLQVKLLRVIEDRHVRRVGSLEPRPIDVRFISATNRDLESEVARGTFRRDLYFRLNGIALVIPPLRERVSEIEPLARTFLGQAAGSSGRSRAPVLSDAARSLLLRYGWPGNIRELRNVMERAVLLCAGAEITPEHLPTEKMTTLFATRSASPAGSGPESEPFDERQRILAVLASCGGSQTHAAKLLRVSRRTLTNWLNRLDIPRPRKGRFND